MNTKEILITGAAGLLGGNLSYLFSTNGYHVTSALNNQFVFIPGVTITRIEELGRLKTDFDYVIHCAAKTDVDGCEKTPSEALDTNVRLTESVVDFANRRNALLVHISTDAVYKDTPEKKTEQSPLEPLSVYAKTKLEAEQLVQAKANTYYILRTNLFGFNILNKYSLSEWVLYNLINNRQINGFYDVLFSPIIVNRMFDVIKCLIDNSQKSNMILNIGSLDGMSKFEFAHRIAEKFELRRDLIARTSVLDFHFIAKRSLNSVMDCTKFQTLFNYKLDPLETEIELFRQAYRDNYHLKLRSFNQSAYVNR